VEGDPEGALNYGLRWEPFIPLHLTLGSVYAFDDERFHKGIKSTVYKNAPAGLYFHGDPGFPEDSAIKPQYGSLAPRMGLAWDPQGDGRTSLRLAYGIAYDFRRFQPCRRALTYAPEQRDHTGRRLDNPIEISRAAIRSVRRESEQRRVLPFADYLPTSSYDMSPLQFNRGISVSGRSRRMCWLPPAISATIRRICGSPVR
jgi:hypothetical protein